jgi:hypothetical protein
MYLCMLCVCDASVTVYPTYLKYVNCMSNVITWCNIFLELKRTRLETSCTNCSFICKSSLNKVLLLLLLLLLLYIYSIITTYQIWLTGVSISTNGNFALCGQRVFRFLISCRQSLLSFRIPGNLNRRKGGTARSLDNSLMEGLPDERPSLETSKFCLYFSGIYIVVYFFHIRTGCYRRLLHWDRPS